MVCSCSVHVLDVAALIHIVRSVRAATFSDCIHMHLVPLYLKSQITPSANDEMNKITLPYRHRIQNLSPGSLRPSTLPLSHGGSSAPHNTYEWSLGVSGKERFVETWMPERGTNPRSPDFSSRPLYNHCISPSSPCPNCPNWEYTNSKRDYPKCLAKKNENKRDYFSCCGQVLSEAMGTCAMLDFQIH